MKKIFTKMALAMPLLMVAALVISCSDDDKGPEGPKVELAMSSAVLEVGGSATADILNVEGNTCTVKVADEFVAAAYVLKSQLVIEAEKAGETKVTVTSGGSSASCNVTVKATDFCAGSPCLDFGCTPAQLDDAIEEGVKVIDSKDLVNITYGNISDIYHFKNSKLVCVSTTVQGVTAEQLKAYLLQRYNYIRSIDSPPMSYFWYERPGKIAVCASPMADNQGWYIRYGATRDAINQYYTTEF